MFFTYTPLETKHKSITGAVPAGTGVTFFVGTDHAEVILSVTKDDGYEKAYPMKATSGGFFACVELESGLYWYRFFADGVKFGGDENLNSVEDGNDYQLTVYSGVDTPFFYGGIIYQIFPDRFNKSGKFTVGKNKVARNDWGGEPTYRGADGEVKNNEFFGGNFKGIKEKLPYLKSLGVTAIYLNPISKAYSSHRYDTGDYLSFDPVLGDENDLKELISEGKKLDIDFIFDGVYNHVGDDSAYFNRYGNYEGAGAYNSAKSRYCRWFCFTNYPDEYVCWWGFKNLPAIKKDCKDYWKFVVDKVLDKYFSLGFKGVRLDVVDELNEEFIRKIKQKAVSFASDNAVVGEVWEDATNKIAYGKRRAYFSGGELDSVMNYPLRDAIVSYLLHADTKDLVKTFNEQLNNYPATSLNSLMNLLSSHDTVRIITVLGRNKVVLDKDLLKYETLDEEQYLKGKTLAKLAYSVVFTCYGVPSVYYGDEAGLTGDLDPYNRRCFPWGREDEDMLSYIRYLSKVRTDSKALRSGTFKIVYCDRRIIIYERVYDGESVIVAVSRECSDVTVRLNGKYRDYSTGKTGDRFVLPSDGALILTNKLE
ncbi:MAG: glycoside hydrolase family 13 protein [Clostridia bacterium]|nr:glycoside hydrolase family 13 protein [Clostridia bacterium]